MCVSFSARVDKFSMPTKCWFDLLDLIYRVGRSRFCCGPFGSGGNGGLQARCLHLLFKMVECRRHIVGLKFPLAYIVCFTARIYFKQWKPRETAFIAADAIYSTASVLAYFHLAHIFQVNSVLGPLQLSLYRMLKDVLKFLAIFFLLYIAFATGVINTYSYYVVSQKQLKEDGDPDQYPAVPRYGKYVYNPMSSN